MATNVAISIRGLTDRMRTFGTLKFRHLKIGLLRTCTTYNGGDLYGQTYYKGDGRGVLRHLRRSIALLAQGLISRFVLVGVKRVRRCKGWSLQRRVLRAIRRLLATMLRGVALGAHIRLFLTRDELRIGLRLRVLTYDRDIYNGVTRQGRCQAKGTRVHGRRLTRFATRLCTINGGYYLRITRKWTLRIVGVEVVTFRQGREELRQCGHIPRLLHRLDTTTITTYTQVKHATHDRGGSIYLMRTISHTRAMRVTFLSRSVGGLNINLRLTTDLNVGPCRHVGCVLHLITCQRGASTTFGLHQRSIALRRRCCVVVYRPVWDAVWGSSISKRVFCRVECFANINGITTSLTNGRRFLTQRARFFVGHCLHSTPNYDGAYRRTYDTTTCGHGSHRDLTTFLD